MQEQEKLPPINQTRFSDAEIKTYFDQLNRQYGAISQAIKLSGFSQNTWNRAMRGQPIKIDTRKKITAANLKVIANIQKNLTTQNDSTTSDSNGFL
jgi:hypothetical protein